MASPWMQSASTPEIDSSLLAIVQGEAARAAQEAQQKAELHDRKLAREDLAIESAKHRAFVSEEGAKERGWKSQGQRQSEAFAQQQAEFEAQQREKQQSGYYQFAQKQWEAGARHDNWVLQNKQNFEMKLKSIDQKMSMLSEAQRAKLGIYRADLDAQLKALDVAHTVVSNKLNGTMESVNRVRQKLMKQSEDIQASHQLSFAKGTSAADHIANQIAINYRSAQNKLGVGNKALLSSDVLAQTIGRGIAALKRMMRGDNFAFPEEDSTPEGLAKTLGAEQGIGPEEIASAFASGAEALAADAPVEVRKKYAANAATIGALVVKMGTTLDMLSKSNLTPSDREQLNQQMNAAKQTIMSIVQEDGLDISTVRGMLKQIPVALRDAAAKQPMGTASQVYSDKLEQLAKGANAVLAAMPKGKEDAAEVLKGVIDAADGMSLSEIEQRLGGLPREQRQGLLKMFEELKKGGEDLGNLRSEEGGLTVKRANAEAGGNKGESRLAASLVQEMIDLQAQLMEAKNGPPEEEPQDSSPWAPGPAVGPQEFGNRASQVGQQVWSAPKQSGPMMAM